MKKIIPIKIIAMLVFCFVLVACSSRTSEVSYLEGIISQLETERYNLFNAINEQTQEMANLQDLVAGLENSSDLQLEENFTVLNPIDSFFAEIRDELYFHDTTWTMIVEGVVIATAWRAEMENFHAILMSRTQNELVKETLNNEIYHFMEYTRSRAEIHAMLDASSAFRDDADDLHFGSLARITRFWVIAQGYRSMALDLLVRLQRLGGRQFDKNYYDFSYFIFDAESFLEWMKQEYPELWRMPRS